MQRPNLKITGIEEGDEQQTNDIDNLFKYIIAENFPNIEKGRDIQVQKAYRTPKRTRKRNTPRHIIIKTLNIQNKERILEAAKEKRLVT
jgi:hypothetical protein